MENKIVAQSTTKREVTYEPIDETYCKYTETITTETPGEDSKVVVNTGIATLKEMSAIKNFQVISREADVDWMWKGKGIIVPIYNSDFEKIKNGTAQIDDVMAKYHLLINEKDESKISYVIYNFGSWELADLNKEIIPYPIRFNYINGAISNKEYNLDVMLEFIKSDSRFMPVKYGRNTSELYIGVIPYYNSDSETNKTIDFLYMPTKEEMHTHFSEGTYGDVLIAEKIFADFKK